MNFGDIKKRVRNIVGDETGIFIETEELDMYVNDGYNDVARRTKILRDIATINIVAGTAEYSLPSNFIMEKRVTIENLRIRKTTIESIDSIDRSKDDPSNKGNSLAYYFWGSKIGLYPTPASAITGGLKVYYVRLPLTALAADADIPEIPVDMHEDIVRYAIARCREQAEDFEIAQANMGEYAQRVAVSTEQAQNLTDTSYPAVRDIDSDYGYFGYYGPYA